MPGRRDSCGRLNHNTKEICHVSLVCWNSFRKSKEKELFKVIRNEVLPILKNQPGFLEILPFLPESVTEKTITVTLWAEKPASYEIGF